MQSLRIKRKRYSNVDDKQILRANIEQLPLDKQREFVSAAFQLIGKRVGMTGVEASVMFINSDKLKSH